MKEFSTDADQEVRGPQRQTVDPCGHRPGDIAAGRDCPQPCCCPHFGASETGFRLLSGLRNGEGINVRVFKATKFMTVHYSSNGELVHKP